MLSQAESERKENGFEHHRGGDQYNADAAEPITGKVEHGRE